MSYSLEQFLKEYNEKISGNRVGSDQRFLVYSVKRHEIFSQSQLVGGLADRLKGIIASFYMATVTGRRFVIDWDAPFDICENFLPAKYDWRFRNAQKFIQKHTTIRHIDLVDRSDLIDDMSPEQIDSTLFGGDPVVVLNINSPRVVFFLKHFESTYGASASYAALFTQAFNFLFRFIEKEEFSESRKSIQDLRNRSDMLTAVHLRTGAGNGWRDPGLDSWENYENILSFAFEFAKDKGAQNPGFYFVSDSIEARRAITEREWPHPVICDQFTPIHLDRSENADRHGNDLTYHEFQMLSEADQLVYGQGGFAALAAYAGGKPIVRYKS